MEVFSERRQRSDFRVVVETGGRRSRRGSYGCEGREDDEVERTSGGIPGLEAEEIDDCEYADRGMTILRRPNQCASSEKAPGPSNPETRVITSRSRISGVPLKKFQAPAVGDRRAIPKPAMTAREQATGVRKPTIKAPPLTMASAQAAKTSRPASWTAAR